ncbi:MAG: HlyC/CorC family transporter [Deltaproteobacteria bacterium]|nr:HlyC/CorC family transporter [Deltaproteobacteria bacterium]
MDGHDIAFPISEIIGMVACIVCSAFFSGSETALTHLAETRIRQLLESQPERYGIFSFWLENKKRILTTLLVGNNLVNILCSVLAYQVAFYFNPGWAEAISVSGLTIILLVFAEITPKNLALHYAESIAVPLLRVIWLVDKPLWIVSKPLTGIPTLLLRKFGHTTDPQVVTEDEIEYQIRLGHDQAVFEEEAQGDLLMSAVKFSDIDVKEVMVPRTDMFGLDLTTPAAEAVEAVIKSGHSRIPVYGDNLDNTIGLLHAKDLLVGLQKRGSVGLPSIQNLIRKPPMFAPETQKISYLLAKMRKRGRHMAIVVDEFGGTSGLITLEDIIEELVGDIRDEFDADEVPIRKVDETTWIVDARVSISDLKDSTGIELPDSGDYESVGGFIVARYGNIPVTGTIVSTEVVQAKILTSDARHIERLEIKLIPKESVREHE